MTDSLFQIATVVAMAATFGYLFALHLRVLPVPKWFPRHEVIVGDASPSECLLMKIVAGGGDVSLYWSEYSKKWACRVEFKRGIGKVEVRSDSHVHPRAAIHEAYTEWKELSDG